MTISIRTATKTDFPRALELVSALLLELGEEGAEAGELALDQLADRAAALGDHHAVFIAVDPDDHLVGVLTLAECFALYANGHYGVINEMYVLPEHRSSRVGQELIRAAATFGQSRGWRRLDVTAPESERWSRTRQFYEREGFVFTGPKLKLQLQADGD